MKTVLAVALLLLALPAPALVAQEPGDVALDRAAMVAQLKAMMQKREWKTIIEQFGQEDFTAWPAESSALAADALHLRGQAYSFLKNGDQAEQDLLAAIELAPKSPHYWLALGDNYATQLKDDAQALAAYKHVLEITGPAQGWQPLTATIAIARLHTDQAKPELALAVLREYDENDKVAPSWRIRLLRAQGHAYAAQGNEQASLAKFRAALALEAQP